MKTLLFTMLLSISVSAQPGIVKAVKWKPDALPAGAKLLQREDGAEILEISNTNQRPMRVELWRMEKPAISAQIYSVWGKIKYEGVEGDGFLEMWSVFPPSKPGADEARYFSRTMAPTGAMGKISGSSDWRFFQLPFDRSGSASPPKRLELNLILPGRGTVYLEPVLLWNGPLRFKDRREWWSEREAGVIGGIGGALIGCLGSLMAMLAAKKKARGFVLSSSYALIALGCALAIAGLAAVFSRQSYSVWFPLVLGAVLLLSLMPSRLRQMRRNYEDHELRRMAAFDAGQR